MRCKCCNVILNKFEMDFNPDTKEFNEMCNRCKYESNSEYDILTDKVYQQSNVKEGMTMVFHPKS